jgi:hypothetical protein
MVCAFSDPSMKPRILIKLMGTPDRWMDGIRLEMKNCRVAFEVYSGDVDELVGYQTISGHLVYDMKLGENFC